ncbi:hypothetical protein ACFLSY_10555, partial [Bacteroidota bacterium]
IQIREIEENFDISRQIKEIRTENLKSVYEAEVYIGKLGVSPRVVIKKAKTEWDIAKLELQQAIKNNANRINAIEAGVRDPDAEICNCFS